MTDLRKKKGNKLSTMLNRVVPALLLALLITGCGFYSERSMYSIAAKAVKKDARFPAGSTVFPAKHAQFYVAKNSACVQVRCALKTPDGQTKNETFVVWLKRVYFDWEIDRVFPEPKYN